MAKLYSPKAVGICLFGEGTVWLPWHGCFLTMCSYLIIRFRQEFDFIAVLCMNLSWNFSSQYRLWLLEIQTGLHNAPAWRSYAPQFHTSFVFLLQQWKCSFVLYFLRCPCIWAYTPLPLPTLSCLPSTHGNTHTHLHNHFRVKVKMCFAS